MNCEIAVEERNGGDLRRVSLVVGGGTEPPRATLGADEALDVDECGGRDHVGLVGELWNEGAEAFAAEREGGGFELKESTCELMNLHALPEMRCFCFP